MLILGREDEIEDRLSDLGPSNQPTTSQVEVLSTCSSRDSGNHSLQINTGDLSSSPLRISPIDWPSTSTTFAENEPLIEPSLLSTVTSTQPILHNHFLHLQQMPIDLCRLSGSKYSLASFHSAATTSSNSQSLCRICHLNKNTTKDPLISPCRCSGSMLYVHKSCLVHWLEISTRKMVPSPRCELCGYFYRRGHFLHLGRPQVPHMDGRDRILNIVFIFVFLIMLICAGMAIHFLHMEHYNTTLRGYRIVSSRLSQEDFIVIGSSILFFVAFFVAIFTQYRAEASVFRVLFRLWVINRNWTIRNYRLDEDAEMLAERERRNANEVARTSIRITTNSKNIPKQ